MNGRVVQAAPSSFSDESVRLTEDPHATDDLWAQSVGSGGSTQTPLGEESGVDSTALRVRPASNPIASKIRTAHDFCQETPVDVPWLVPGILALGASTEFVGAPKAAGKTTFLLSLCAAVIEGRDFLGYRTTKTKVLYLTEQAGTSFRQALVRAGLSESSDFHFLPWFDCREQEWADIVEIATARAKELGVGLLVVDTLGQFAGFRGDDESNSGAAQKAMAPLQNAAGLHGFGVAVARHSRKSGGPVGLSGRGSSAFTGGVDICFVLERFEGQANGSHRKLESLSRFDETPALLTIEWDGETYISLGETSAPLTARAGRGILSALSLETESAVTVADLERSLKIPKSTINDALRELDAEGLVARIGRGRKNDAYRWYRISSDDSPSLSGAESDAA